ncbi:MAG TPA: thiamine pyrophosphate-dependent enzyme [Candidatus Limnocylindrales bacterium]|nr:thiamine pyrophosphate-dependent enzyme [Candidatus Limnocylindrales bacterium]
MKEGLKVGLSFEQTITVAPEEGITYLGPEYPSVFSTPSMIRLMEDTSRKLLEPYLDQGESSVGTAVNIRHLRPTPIGMKVTARSRLIEIRDRRCMFEVEAYNEREKIGEGFHERAIIDKKRFAAKAKPEQPTDSLSGKSYRMKGAEAVIQTLKAEGTEVIFGIPGVHALPLYDVLIDYPEIRHIQTMHEQGAGFMADAYARVTGKPGVCLITPGPGGGNVITPAMEAYASSSPVLILMAQIHSKLVDSGKGGVHEVKDHYNLFKSVTRWNHRVKSVEEIPSVIREAFKKLKTQRPGPVQIEIPTDILSSEGQITIPEKVPWTRRSGDPQKIKEAIDILHQVRNPLILAGGGTIRSGAELEIRELAERLSAPVITTFQGKGILPEDHPLALGCINGLLIYRGNPVKSPFVQKFLSKVDCLMIIGTKLGEATTDNWRLPLPVRRIQIDLDEKEIGKNYPVEVGIVGDARQVLAEILKELKEKNLSRVSEWEEVQNTVTELKKEIEGLLKSGRREKELQIVWDLQEVLEPDAIVANDMTIMTYWTGRYFKVRRPRTFLYPYGSTTLGFGLPAAIGAKVAYPDRQVIALCGDGGFMFTCQELATAVKYQLNIPILIFNDRSYGVLKGFQEIRYGRSFEVDLYTPDFVKFAEAFGARGIRLKDPSELKSALKEALYSNFTTIIEIPGTFQVPWLSLE